MITTLSLRKFQSWNRVDMELAPITVITGRGNTGKSALLRAIKYALTNKGGDDFIRYGARETSVGLTFDNDVSIMWNKGRGEGGRYWLWTARREQEFSKTGTTVPPAIVEATGIRPLEVEKGSVIWPQLRLQFDGPFLVSESGTRTARILGKLTKLDLLVTAQMKVRREKDSNQRTADVIERQRGQVEEKIRTLPDLDALRYYLADAQAAVDEAHTRAGWAAKANHAAKRIRIDAIDQHRRLQDFLQACEAVNVLQWRARKARAAVKAYKQALELQEAARAPISCCQ